MFQRKIDIVARLVVQAIACPFELIRIALERYMDLMERNPKVLYFHFFFLIGLIIITFVHFHL
ncbi:hypothetical protein SAMD00079811_83270 (plasmid) [Scytonema sp. HK-05]|uniref:hypothetical protein n=1 Tax=Scytonema sp. HK-05 TaxID=1137095 RepID=UPI000935B63B|nr:hypothetical protein [Scytonema sp. HK-05]OKH44709.1 hypothetical protein NIES2130_37765 [Scytonema sp. HK-05]BAY50696.1 hypothetical protein SAMD00079811_83270 [Scytonema sp. HK-05]